MSRYPGAVWRPIAHNVGGGLRPTAAVLHTAADRGAPDHSSLWAWFNNPARHGTSAHMFIEGDGSAEQYIDTGNVAGHAWDANHFALGIETHDGGHPENPWTGGQVLRLVDLMHWCRDALGIPIQPVTGERGTGWGYHQEFNAWNQSGHNCPGPTRVGQIHGIISLAAAVHHDPVPPAPQPVVNYRQLAAGQWLPWFELLPVPMGSATPPGPPVVLLQKVLNLIQNGSLQLDGVYSPATGQAVAKFQGDTVALLGAHSITDAYPGVLSNETKFFLACALANIAKGVTP